jgi:hypothetical protein
MSNEFSVLQGRLGRIDARRRRQTLLIWLPRALLVGLLPALVVGGAARVRPLLTRAELALLAVALVVAALALAALVVLLRRRPLAEQARFADRRFGLRERATAAVEIHAGLLTVPADLAARQLADAVAVAEAIEPTRQMPLSAAPRDWLPALAGLAALALVLVWPNPQESLLREQRAVTEAIEERAAALETLIADVAADETLTAEQREALARPLEEALAALREPDASRQAAVAALSEAEAELRALGDAPGPNAVGEALAGAAGALVGNEATAALGEALENAELGRAGAAAAALADALPDLDAATRADLAATLAQAADALRGVDEALADQLDRAAAALAAGETAAAQEALREAAGALQERAQEMAAAERAREAADALNEARGAVAQAGEPAADGQTARPGGGEGGDPAAGQAGGPDGAEPAAGANGTTGGQGENAGGQPGPGGGHVESVFVPAPAELDGAGQNVELDTQCLGDPAACGPLGQQSPAATAPGAGGGMVPYDQVFGDYRDAAFEALSGGAIPSGLESLVRDYFSSLEP